MTVDMSQEEIALVLQVLQNYLGDLRMEIADTDRSDFKETLHQREDSINHIIQKLSAKVA